MLEKLHEKQIYETSSYCLKVGKLYRKQKTTQRDTRKLKTLLSTRQFLSQLS